MSKHLDKKFPKPRIMPDGSIMYAKKGWEPPPPIEGYQCNPHNRWHFIRLWPDCSKRVEEHARKECGAIQIVMTCEGKTVTFGKCAVCKKLGG